MALKDLVHGCRLMRRRPVVSLVGILSLALGIAGATVVFDMSATLMRPLPFRDPDRIVRLSVGSPRHLSDSMPLELYSQWKSEAAAFDQLSAYLQCNLDLGVRGDVERVAGAIISADLFSTLGVKALVGRGFLPEDDQFTASGVTMISDRLWHSRLGADPSWLGRAVSLNRRSYVVVGVVPAAAAIPPGIDVWIPCPMRYAEILDSGRSSSYFVVVGRIRGGLSFEEAAASLSVLAAQVKSGVAGADPERGLTVSLTPIRKVLLGDQISVAAMSALAAALFLLIACANVASILLAEAAARGIETAVRIALGAGPSRLVSQRLTEGLALALAGGAGGFLLSVWITGAIRSAVPAMLAGSICGATLRSAVFAAVLTLFTGALVGLAPAIGASRTDLVHAMKGRPSPSRAASRRIGFRGMLVVSQIAIALVFLIATGLVLRTLHQMLGPNLGLAADHSLAFDIRLPATRYPDIDSQSQFVERVRESIERIPGVLHAGAINFFPVGGGSFPISVKVSAAPQEPIRADYVLVTPGYFRAAGIPLRQGRDFTRADTRSALPVIIVDERIARRLWPGGEVVGRSVEVFGRGRAVVGVAGSVGFRGTGPAAAASQIYFPFPQAYVPNLRATIVARAAVDPLSLSPAARRAIAEIDSTLAPSRIGTVEQRLAEATSRQRHAAFFLVSFAAVAAFLAAMGVYGAASCSVAERTREIGIRMALGATPGAVLGQVLRQGFRLAAAGIAAGVGAALTLVRFMASLLYGTRPEDLPTYTAAALLLGAAAVAASYGPARRAAQADPALILRSP